jgi:FAD/FMN-containing dehydrogenase
MSQTDISPRVPPRRFTGLVLGPDDPGYNDARAVFNGMIDKFPQLITQCTTPDDVVAAIRHGVDRGLEIAVRGGGHSARGSGITEGGMVIDLRRMNTVEIDPVRQVARVGGGATWSDFDRTAQKYGLATTGGRNSRTGVAGLTLGGGSGWLERQHGFASDNLLSVDLVTADGRQVTASETEHTELFWALHGGGGNFGVATALTFKLYVVPRIATATLIWPWASYADVVRIFRDIFDGEPPRQLSGAVMATTDPPDAVAPAEVHCRLATKVTAVHTGSTDELTELIEPLLASAPASQVVAETPYADLQKSQDGPAGLRSYWTVGYLESLSEQVIDAGTDWAARVPDQTVTRVAIAPWGGAVAESADRWPMPYRKAPWVVAPMAHWESPAHDDRAIGWVQELRGLLRRDGMGAGLGAANHQRLAKVKAAYDPGNVFHLNHNILPAQN